MYDPTKCWASPDYLLDLPCPTMPDTCHGGQCTHRTGPLHCQNACYTELGLCPTCWSLMTGRPAEEATR